MSKKNKEHPSNSDANNFISLIKWGLIGTAATATVVGGGYYLVSHAIKKSKQNNEYGSTLETNSKGKTKNSTVGTGQTPSAYAQLLNAALKATNWAGIPDTDEDSIYKLLGELRTQYEIALVAKSYQGLYNKPLQKGLEDDLDADEFARAIGIITSKPAK